MTGINLNIKEENKMANILDDLTKYRVKVERMAKRSSISPESSAFPACLPHRSWAFSG